MKFKARFIPPEKNEIFECEVSYQRFSTAMKIKGNRDEIAALGIGKGWTVIVAGQWREINKCFFDRYWWKTVLMLEPVYNLNDLVMENEFLRTGKVKKNVRPFWTKGCS